MLRSIRYSSSALLILFALMPTAAALEPPEKDKPVRPLAELARDLKDPDLEKRCEAAEAIRKHYTGKTLEVMPQILVVLGEVLDQPRDCPVPELSLLSQMEYTLWVAAYGSGVSWMKLIRESTQHPDARIRAAAFRVWLKPVNREANLAEDRDELLVSIRRGIKDDSPLVRGQAAFALRAFWDAPPEMSKVALSLLVAALDDRVKSRKGVDCPAFNAASALTWFQAKANVAVSALGKAANTDDTRLTWQAISTLNTIAKADGMVAGDVVNIYRALFTDKRLIESSREDAIRNTSGIGPASSLAIADFVDLLNDPALSVQLKSAVVFALAKMGLGAAPAVPALIERLECSVTHWEQLQLVYGVLTMTSKILTVSGFVVPKSVSKFVRGGQITIRTGLFMYEFECKLEADQGYILLALKELGPIAAAAIEPLKRYRDKIRGHIILEDKADNALAAIDR